MYARLCVWSTLSTLKASNFAIQWEMKLCISFINSTSDFHVCNNALQLETAHCVFVIRKEKCVIEIQWKLRFNAVHRCVLLLHSPTGNAHTDYYTHLRAYSTFFPLSLAFFYFFFRRKRERAIWRFFFSNPWQALKTVRFVSIESVFFGHRNAFCVYYTMKNTNL